LEKRKNLLKAKETGADLRESLLQRGGRKKMKPKFRQEKE